MKAGLFDIVSLRVSQNSRDEPTLLGLDLVGASPDYATGRKVAKAYFDTVDARLQQQFGVKLLGVWPFGPQILFCKKPIAKLADIKGMKVRVYDQNLAKFIEMVGGTPVPVSFADTHQSLSLGVVDCAITGPSSANSAGWPEVTTHQLPLGFQMALNGYGITLKAWNQLKPDQQAKLKTAFDSPDRRHLEVLRRAVPGRAELQRRQGPVHHRQEVQADQRAGDAGRRRAGAQRRDQGVAAGLGRGLRQVQPRLLAEVASHGRPGAGTEMNAAARQADVSPPAGRAATSSKQASMKERIENALATVFGADLPAAWPRW